MTRLVSLRGEDPPDDATTVIRGGEQGIAPDTLRRTATRSFDEFGFYGISVFVALDGSVAELCRDVDAIRRYGRIRRSTVGRLRRAGFPLIATGRRPHFDIVLPDLTDDTLGRLADCFDPAEPNPGRS